MIHDDLVLHVEAALLAAGRPVPIDEFISMFEGREDAPDRSAVREAVAALEERWAGRAIEVSEVASGYRAQIRKEYSQSIAALWQERPPRYSRALLETLALIAYRQPISRGEIEEVRGVSVSSSIMKTLLEREWVRVVGHREVPGRPALFGTTRHFLDTFNLKGPGGPAAARGTQGPRRAAPGSLRRSSGSGRARRGGRTRRQPVQAVNRNPVTRARRSIRTARTRGSVEHDPPEPAEPAGGPAEEAAESASSGGGDGMAGSSAIDDSAASVPEAGAGRGGPAD